MIDKGYARFAANQGSIALQRDDGSLATAERLRSTPSDQQVT
jgi:hypothetical protein